MNQIMEVVVVIPDIPIGSVLEFHNPETDTYYDGIVWKKINEGNNFSLFIRFVDKIPFAAFGDKI